MIENCLMHDIDPDEEQKEVIWEENHRWWNGKINTFSGIGSQDLAPTFVTIMDLTLREGEEVPGTSLTLDEKIKLAKKIVEVGFKEMEVGYAGVIDEHRKVVRALKKEGLPVALASHTRIYGQENEWKAEIDKNLECGVDILTFVGFASEVGTATTPWLSKDEIPNRISACVEYAKQQGAIVTFGLADMVRTQLNMLISCYRNAYEAGADRLYVYDGLGAAKPEAIEYLTKLLRDISDPDMQLGVHVHDTFGLSTAAVIQAVLAGVSVVDAVPLGLGDGAGITASEEIAIALQVLYGIETGIEISEFKALCEEVSEVFGIPIPDGKSLIGRNQYTHSIDSHVAAILRGAWHSWEVIRPDVIGQSRNLQFGFSKLREGKSGALYAKAQVLGYDPSREQMDEILEGVRTITYDRRFATEADVEKVIQEVLEK